MAKKKNPYAEMYTIRSDGRYQGYYRDKDNKRHTVCDKDPEKLYYKILEKSAPAPTPLFRNVADDWKEWHYRSIRVATQNSYDRHIDRLCSEFGDSPIDQITTPEIQNFLSGLVLEDCSAEVIRAIKSTISQIFRFVITSKKYENVIHYNPADSTFVPKEAKHCGKREAPTEDIIKLIQRVADVAPFGDFAMFLICTGFRRGEALAVQWQDIDFKAKTISCNKQITLNGKPVQGATKTPSAIRLVPILTPMLKILEKPEGAKPTDYVFPHPASPDKPMTLTVFRQSWERFTKYIGQPSLVPHQLRHGYATMLYEAGVDIYTAQKLLGHANIEVTSQIYTHLREKQKSKNIDKLLEYTENGIT